MGDLSLSPGASECTSCPDYSDSPAGSRSCLCNAGYFEHNITYAYWDVGDCGPNGDDARWSWCDQRNFTCQQEVITDECDSGFAKLKSTQGNEQSLKSGSVTIQGCGYHYFAIYECTGIFKLVYGTCICTFIAAPSHAYARAVSASISRSFRASRSLSHADACAEACP